MEPSAKIKARSAPEKLDEFDQRLEAIKDILLGDTFKKLEKQIKGINHMVDTGNSHLLTIVDELSKEVVELKSDLNRHKAEEGRNRFEEDEEIRNAVHKLNTDFTKKVEEQNQKLDVQNQRLDKLARIQDRIENLEEEAEAVLQKVTKDLDHRVDLIESDMEKRMEAQFQKSSDQYEQLENKNKEVHQKLEQELQSLQNTLEKRILEQKEKIETTQNTASEEQLARLKREFRAEIDALKLEMNDTEGKREILRRLQQLEERTAANEQKTDQRFSNWKEQLNAKLGELDQSQKEGQQKLAGRQDKFENSVGNLMENLAVQVSRKLNGEKEDRQKVSSEVDRLKSLFKEGNQILANEQERVNQRLDKVEETNHALKEVFQKEVHQYFDAMAKERGSLDDKLSTMQQEFSRQMREATLRMETRMETMLEMNQRHMQQMADVNSNKKTKKDELKETLKRLTDLLDD